MLTSTGKHSIAASARSQFFGRDFESANGAHNPCIAMKVAVLENTTSSNVVWELWLAEPPNTISQHHEQLHFRQVHFADAHAALAMLCVLHSLAHYSATLANAVPASYLVLLWHHCCKLPRCVGEILHILPMC